MNIIELNTDPTTLSKIIEYLQLLQVKFTVKEQEQSPYNKAFVKKVLKAREGKSTRVNPENIWESIL